MSATKSASTGMPYLKPKLTTVTFSRVASGVPNASATRSVSWCTLRSEVSMTRSASPRRSASTLALAVEPVEQPAAALQRVRPARGLLAADQHVVGGLEEQQRGPPAGGALGEVGLERGEERPATRTSTTTAIGWSVPRLSSTSRTTSRSSVGGRLSTTKQPRSSSSLAAVLRPAPVMPVTTTSSPRWRRSAASSACRSSPRSVISPVAVLTATVCRPLRLPVDRILDRRGGARCRSRAPRRSPRPWPPAASAASRSA